MFPSWSAVSKLIKRNPLPRDIHNLGDLSEIISILNYSNTQIQFRKSEQIFSLRLTNCLKKRLKSITSSKIHQPTISHSNQVKSPRSGMKITINIYGYNIPTSPLTSSSTHTIKYHFPTPNCCMWPLKSRLRCLLNKHAVKYRRLITVLAKFVFASP